jgi:hypothetical protein
VPGLCECCDGVGVRVVLRVGWSISGLSLSQLAAGCVFLWGGWVFWGDSMSCCHGVLCSCSWIDFLYEHGVVVEVRRVGVCVAIV